MTAVEPTFAHLGLPMARAWPASPEFPHAWRANGPRLRCQRCPRFTSTRVEIAPTCAASATRRPGHLHGREEHQVVFDVTFNVFGSPPRAWRTHGPAAKNAVHVRVTSTSMVSTAACPGTCGSRTVRFHGPGERRSAPPGPPRASRSPPRACGARTEHAQARPRRRVTSTCMKSARQMARAAFRG